MVADVPLVALGDAGDRLRKTGGVVSTTNVATTSGDGSPNGFETWTRSVCDPSPSATDGWSLKVFETASKANPLSADPSRVALIA